MYDKFSSDYDRFVNWKNRLSAEMPFLEETITKAFPSKHTNLRILDAATGTGMHAVEFAKHGFEVCGADLSDGMIQQARKNAANVQSKVRFETAGFGNLAQTFELSTSTSVGNKSDMLGFDVVLCLGNSLPHVSSSADLDIALKDFANCLKPGGMLIIQNRNFDAVMSARERWMEPQSHIESDKEWVFLRFYDYLPDGLINFNIITLTRAGNEGWKQSISETHLMPLMAEDTRISLRSAGFEKVDFYGGLDGSTFNPASSGNLVITARKK